ncbi:hypothetical protein SAMN05216226_10266 [Halovenus aranensis]|uniref:Uncharacterized protein n=2 Tax=Halovenus aranensis TaxID=890420 RepID=A0A1G8SNF4_9EURY|nr:hypothetical protein SAMN05216226_10266 [Halovenus aranensis]
MMTETSSSAELSGQYIASLVESAGDVSPVFERKVRDIFKEYISTEIEYDQWYPVPEVTDTYQRIARQVGSSTMQEGGAASAQAVEWPDHVTRVADGLELLNDMHQQAHRGGEEAHPGGQYLVETEDARAARVAVSSDWPYTVPLAEGVFKGIVKDLGDDDAVPSLEDVESRHDEEAAWKLTW